MTQAAASTRELVPLDYADGDVAMRGELALPAGDGPHPGVLVLHGGAGLTDDVRDYARRLAGRGYAAMAADLFGANGAVPAIDVPGGSMKALQAEPARLRARVRSGFEALAAHSAVDGDRLAAVGFCFGGQCALELARDGADLRATVSLHGLLTTEIPARPGSLRGEVAVFTGAKDPLAPSAHVEQLRDELTRAGVRWQITVYGEGWHGFTDRHSHLRYDWIRYDPLLDAQSWAATLALLDNTLSPAPQFAQVARAPAAIH